MSRSAVYLVESSKGFVSVLNHSFDADIKLVVVLGPLNIGNSGLSQNISLIFCRSALPTEVRRCKSEILRRVGNSDVTLIATDDTFNRMSYTIFHALAKLGPRLVLLDHLRVSGLTYKEKFKLRSYLRFRKVFIRFPCSFVAIQFSNGVIGYKLALPYSRTEYSGGLGIASQIAIPPQYKVVVLIPLFVDEESKCFVKYFDDIIERWSTRHEVTSKIAIKLHPRATAFDRKYLRSYALLANCYELDANTPLELLDLKDKLVINFQSSFSVDSGVDVILMASLFGYSKVMSSNMTGNGSYTFEAVEASILQKLLA